MKCPWNAYENMAFSAAGNRGDIIGVRDMMGISHGQAIFFRYFFCMFYPVGCPHTWLLVAGSFPSHGGLDGKIIELNRISPRIGLHHWRWNMEVSWNTGTPRSTIFILFSIINIHKPSIFIQVATLRYGQRPRPMGVTTNCIPNILMAAAVFLKLKSQ